MSWIEGVGDEVTACITVACILVVTIIAWYSTAVSERAFSYYILVIERRARSLQNSQSSNRTVEPQQSEGLSSSVVASSQESSAAVNKTETDLGLQNTDCDYQTSQRESSNVACESAASSTVAHTDSSNQTSGKNGTNQEQLPVEKTTSELCVEAVGKLPPFPEDSLEMFQESESLLDQSDEIHIRLKFLNDTQQEVTARLGDKVGDFKRTHFADDLASNKIVRLIFNGQVLRNDQDTLQSYGVNNGCVVHCLIVSSSEPGPVLPPEEREGLEVGSLMLPLFGLILSLIWYCRIQHRQYFNTSSTLALTGVTCLFFLALVAMYWPYQSDNRQRITELENNHQRNNGFEDIHSSGSTLTNQQTARS